MAYKRGSADACNDFGVKTASAVTALGALAGAGMGYLADPEHSWQAGVMGGIGGGLAGHGLSRAGVGAANALKSVAAPAAPKPAAPQVSNAAVQDALKMQKTLDLERAAHQAHVSAAAPVPNLSVEELRAGAPNVPRLDGKPMPPKKTIGRKKQSSFEQFKLAVNTGYGFNRNGPSISIMDDPAERLPGMSRWVPRNVIEDVYKQLDMGTDPEDVHAEHRPGVAAVGGGLLGGAAGLMAAGPAGGLMGAGVGAAGGLGLHMLGRKGREADTREALKGVLAERSNRQAQPKESARESMPLTVGTNIGM